VELARLFLEAGARPPASYDLSVLDSDLRSLWETGKAEWPEVDLGVEILARHLAERLPPDFEPAALRGLYAGDLYLACACSLGNPRALAIFDREFVSPVSAFLLQPESLPGFGEDLKQTVRERLLVAGEGLRPRIATYSGRGPLAAWLRVTAVRAALNLRASQKQGEPLDNLDGLALSTAAPDVELHLLRTHYADQFRDAFRTALGTLSPNERNLLRFHFLLGTTAQALATMHGVSRRQVHRWIEQTRQKLLSETRRHLNQRLDISAEDLGSLMRGLQSELASTILEHLGREP
jgi:RNA polymerase sigma-70 factor, ECF subfamily